MKRVEWTEAFSIGIEEIDRQHRHLIDIINRLIEAEGVQTRSETIADLLSEMTRYGREHLKYEEELLEERGYPDLERHKSPHRAYRKKTVDFCTATTIGVDAVPGALLNYLREWWVHHIVYEDKKYASFVCEGQKT